ncbi:3864_t:CDS:2 [Ambispora leptoticha]|uniref:3864_t:CDS:1 n=1 Tax=Ambispora leptoticha TaxID=144679 RepID=A0A9N9AST7_9GLOM|nr:3864_t:CDS:2 [Ambispora leptoticha]
MDNQLKNLSELEAYTFSQSNAFQQVIQQPTPVYNQAPTKKDCTQSTTKNTEEILAYNQLKLIQDAARLSNKPQVTPKPKRFTKAQQKQNSEMLSDMTSRCIRGSKNTTSSNQSLKPADSTSQIRSRPKMSKEELAQARLVRRQNMASLAHRAVTGMTTQIHIMDLFKMVSPAMRVELRKAFMGKDDISSEPMQIANLAEQGIEIPQATVAYVSGYIDDDKFNNCILDSCSNVNMIDGEFFNSLGDFLIIENLGHPIVLGTKWIKQVGGSIDILYDIFQMIVDEETFYVPIQTERICNLAIQDFDTDISTPAEK